LGNQGRVALLDRQLGLLLGAIALLLGFELLLRRPALGELGLAPRGLGRGLLFLGNPLGRLGHGVLPVRKSCDQCEDGRREDHSAKGRSPDALRARPLGIRHLGTRSDEGAQRLHFAADEALRIFEQPVARTREQQTVEQFAALLLLRCLRVVLMRSADALEVGEKTPAVR
jgi:hypothetical protein